MRKLVFAGATQLALVAPLPAAPAMAEPTVSASQASAIGLAQDRGRLIYAYDRIAWLGTDDMLAKLPGAAQTVGGWVVDGPADAPELAFYDRDEVNPHIVYLANIRGGKLAGRVASSEADRIVSPTRRALIEATRAARRRFEASRVVRCAKAPFNTVVLPPSASGDPTLVYFLSPQTSNEIIPIGGHYVVEVAADGRAARPRAFSRSCLQMPIRPPKGTESAAMVVSHLLDPVPTEIHVFSSLVIDLPLVVVTTGNNRGWRIEHGEIRPIDIKRLAGPGASTS